MVRNVAMIWKPHFKQVKFDGGFGHQKMMTGMRIPAWGAHQKMSSFGGSGPSLTDTTEFDKGFCLGANVPPNVATRIHSIIQGHWDCFYEASARKPILGFEFAINTGGSPPACCRKPQYGPHESGIIMDHINSLLHNEWIRECSSAWGALIVLAPKLHQEHIKNIKDFIWRMCVSYCKLNVVTLAFEYPIPPCDDAIDDFGDGFG